jgi:hypothetical protein
MQGRDGEPGQVLRLTFRWGDTVVDSFGFRAEDGPHHHQMLRGGALKAEWDPEDNVVVLTLDESDVAEVSPGAHSRLAGFTVRCDHDFPVPPASLPLLLDGRWLHALMIAIAVQVCAVSAFLLTPSSEPDPEAGGGMTLAEVERFIAVPVGSAALGEGERFVAQGRQPEEAERPLLEESAARSPIAPRASVRFSQEPVFAASAFGPLARSANDSLAELKEQLGEQTDLKARSEKEGDGRGGLLGPRELAEPTDGPGTVGVGSSQVAERLREQDKRYERRTAQEPQPIRRQLPVIPVSTTRIPDGRVALDPLVRDFIGQRVRERSATIRHCYETFGLAADPRLTGKVTLELTLQTDGRVTDLAATPDTSRLQGVASCIENRAAGWYLGDVLPDQPRRLSFPFHLVPKSEAAQWDFR